MLLTSMSQTLQAPLHCIANSKILLEHSFEPPLDCAFLRGERGFFSFALVFGPIWCLMKSSASPSQNSLHSVTQHILYSIDSGPGHSWSRPASPALAGEASMVQPLRKPEPSNTKHTLVLSSQSHPYWERLNVCMKRHSLQEHYLQKPQSTKSPSVCQQEKEKLWYSHKTEYYTEMKVSRLLLYRKQRRISHNDAWKPDMKEHILCDFVYIYSSKHKEN